MLTDKDKLIVAKHLQIALGFMQISRTLLRASAQEPEIRTGFSRLYYAFFHAGSALLLSVGIPDQRLRHGRLPTEIDRRLGKAGNISKTMRSLYDIRRSSDYDNPKLLGDYVQDLNGARRLAVYELAEVTPVFNWIYYEARKVLKQEKV